MQRKRLFESGKSSHSQFSRINFAAAYDDDDRLFHREQAIARDNLAFRLAFVVAFIYLAVAYLPDPFIH